MDDTSPTNRRELLGNLLDKAIDHVMRTLPGPLLEKDAEDGREPIWLRPPGSTDWDGLAARCNRCGDCVKACPAGAIVLDGVPVVIAAHQPCKLCATQPCSASCPSGALEPTPADTVRMGVAIWSPLRCLLTTGQECDACVRPCPRLAIRREGQRLFIDGDRCAGCGVCEHKCPARPRAIHVDPL